MSVASPAPRVPLSLGGGLLRSAAPSTGDPRPPASAGPTNSPPPRPRRRSRGPRRRGERVFGNVPVLADAGDDAPQRGAIGGAAEGWGVRAELSGRKVKRRLAGASQVERRSEELPPRMRKLVMTPPQRDDTAGADAGRGPGRRRSTRRRGGRP